MTDKSTPSKSLRGIYSDILVKELSTHRAENLDEAIERLNQRLANAEAFLAALPGKGPAHVEIEQGKGIALFREGDMWVLGLDPKVDAPDVAVKRWHKCTLEEKAALARGLHPLLEQLLAITEDRHKVVTGAHGALDQFESRIRTIGGKG